MGREGRGQIRCHLAAVTPPGGRGWETGTRNSPAGGGLQINAGMQMRVVSVNYSAPAERGPALRASRSILWDEEGLELLREGNLGVGFRENSSSGGCRALERLPRERSRLQELQEGLGDAPEGQGGILGWLGRIPEGLFQPGYSTIPRGAAPAVTQAFPALPQRDFRPFHQSRPFPTQSRGPSAPMESPQNIGTSRFPNDSRSLPCARGVIRALSSQLINPNQTS